MLTSSEFENLKSFAEGNGLLSGQGKNKVQALLDQIEESFVSQGARTSRAIMKECVGQAVPDRTGEPGKNENLGIHVRTEGDSQVADEHRKSRL